MMETQREGNAFGAAWPNRLGQRRGKAIVSKGLSLKKNVQVNENFDDRRYSCRINSRFQEAAALSVFMLNFPALLAKVNNEYCH